ncbi:MAG: response regulator transcription factor [Chloroflexi bacterium]|nr:response regulator transcription factor [Chloroflexota bacterium]
MNKSQKALLVEDDPFMRGAVEDFLIDHDFVVTAVSTYTQAVQVAMEGGAISYQLAILDISLPYSSDEDRAVRKPLGIDLCRRLKRHNPDCGVILWSAYSHYLPEVTQFVAEGVKGLAYIPKGSRMTTLQKAITEVLLGEVVLGVRYDNSYDEGVESRFVSSLPQELAEIVVEVTRRLPLLTTRQFQVMELLPRNPQAIAQELNLAVATVRNYIDAAYARLGLRDGDFYTQLYRREAIIVLAFVLEKLQQRQRK